MSNLVDKLGDAHKLLDVLSWKKLLQLALFVIILGIAWAGYDNKAEIYGYITHKRIDPNSAQPKELLLASRAQINAVVDKSDLIGSVTVTLADFQKNQRILVYSYVNQGHSDLKSMYAKYALNSFGNAQLFGDVPEDNRQLIGLINGEFVCTPYDGTLIQRLAPDTSKYIKYTCSNGIPAAYGRFKGIISLYLTRQPKADEQEQLKIVARSLSTLIFDNDLDA